MTIMADELTFLLTTLNCCSNVGNIEAVISSPSVKCVILEGALRNLSMQTIGLQGLWHTKLLSALQWLFPLTKVNWVTKYRGKQPLKCCHSISLTFVMSHYMYQQLFLGCFLSSFLLYSLPPSPRLVEEAASVLGKDTALLARVMEWCEAKDHAGVRGEANRLLAALIRHSRNPVSFRHTQYV